MRKPPDPIVATQLFEIVQTIMAHIDSEMTELSHLLELRSPVSQTNASMCLLLSRQRSEDVRGLSSNFDKRLHRLQTQHNQLVTEQKQLARKPVDDEQLAQLDTAIASLHSTSKLSKQQTALQAHLRDALGGTMAKHWPGAALALFGSSGSGFGTKGSDIDVCLCLQDLHEEREACCAKMTRALLQSRQQFLGKAAVKAFDGELEDTQDGKKDGGEMAEMVVRGQRSTAMANVVQRMGELLEEESLALKKKLGGGDAEGEGVEALLGALDLTDKGGSEDAEDAEVAAAAVAEAEAEAAKAAKAAKATMAVLQGLSLMQLIGKCGELSVDNTNATSKPALIALLAEAMAPRPTVSSDGDGAGKEEEKGEAERKLIDATGWNDGSGWRWSKGSDLQERYFVRVCTGSACRTTSSACNIV
jgi:hypothetical protein